MRDVILAGELGKKYGRRHRLDVKSPAEAVRAFMANFPDFEKTINALSESGKKFMVFNGRENAGETQLSISGDGKIIIAPVIAGAKRGGILQIIAGVVLIVVGAVLSYLGYGIGVPLIKFGAALVFGGIVQLLTPIPSANAPNEQAGNRPNNSFDGPVNTTAQGHPVSIGYGRVIVGSAVISASIEIADLAGAQSITAG